jgi:hypothetical protein
VRQESRGRAAITASPDPIDSPELHALGLHVGVAAVKFVPYFNLKISLTSRLEELLGCYFMVVLHPTVRHNEEFGLPAQVT